MKPVRKAVFPVAGLGTRFLPATKAIPKEMLTVVDRPLIQYAVDEAREAGIEQMIFVTGRGKGALEDHFDIAYELEATMRARGKSLDALEATRFPPGAVVSVRQQEPLGLGHAVWCARDIVGDEPFAVFLPDEVMVGRPNCMRQLVDAYEKVGGNVVAVLEVPEDETHKYGVVDPGARDGNLTEIRGLVEKPASGTAPSNLMLPGRYVLQPEVMRILDKQEKGAGGEIQLTDALAQLIGRQPFHGLTFRGERHDCGHKEGFVIANIALALQREDVAPAVRAFIADFEMSCSALLVADGPVRAVSPEEASSYSGPGFIWIHIEGADESDLAVLKGQGDIPDVAANALVATETRPRCDRIEFGALVNLRGLAAVETDDSDRLVSIRLWVRAGKVNSVTRRPLAATQLVRQQMEEGRVLDPGDLVAAFAKAISKQLDPQVADLGDKLDDLESSFEPRQVYRLRITIAQIRSEAIAFRRFVAPDRDALETLSHLDFEWLAEEDRLHIREAADRFARMTEELEAVRERSALLHEQLTDLRAEQLDQRSLILAIVALIFLPLTFITGLLGMNVQGIPYAEKPWAFWAVTGFCFLIALGVAAFFARKHWLSR